MSMATSLFSMLQLRQSNRRARLVSPAEPSLRCFPAATSASAHVAFLLPCADRYSVVTGTRAGCRLTTRFHTRRNNTPMPRLMPGDEPDDELDILTGQRRPRRLNDRRLHQPKMDQTALRASLQGDGTRAAVDLVFDAGVNASGEEQAYLVEQLTPRSSTRRRSRACCAASRAVRKPTSIVARRILTPACSGSRPRSIVRESFATSRTIRFTARGGPSSMCAAKPSTSITTGACE